MTNTNEIIEQAKRVMEQNGIMGVQFMEMKNGIVTFEAFGVTTDTYVNYTVDVDQAIDNGEIEIVKVNVAVEDYDGEIDVTVNTFTYDNQLKQVDYTCEEVKTYKRINAAVKKAKDLARTIKGANIIYI